MKKTLLILLTTLMFSGSAFAGSLKTYEVTVTNITPGQTFTPLLAATHSADVSFFELGAPASDELEMLAEGGDTMPLQDLLELMPGKVQSTVTTAGLLGPGMSVTFEIQAGRLTNFLSFAGMFLPTNDTFVALDAMLLPFRSMTETTAVAYDAGTEINDEDCDNIPGPFCMGDAVSVADGEGFVHVGSGIHGIGDLPADLFDWRNPVAKVTVRRVR